MNNTATTTAQMRALADACFTTRNTYHMALAMLDGIAAASAAYKAAEAAYDAAEITYVAND